MKVPLAEQIASVQWALTLDFSADTYAALEAALSTLKWVERHQAELRVLGEFPIEAVTVREAGE
jgi:hypothetical protein